MLNSLRGLYPRRLSLTHILQSPVATRRLRQVLIVAATLILAYNFGRRPSLTYVFLPLVLVMLWLVYTRPGLGVVGLLVSAIVVPFALGTGTGSPLNIVLLGIPALLGLWLVEMVRERQIKLVPSATNLPLLGLIATISVSFVVGYLPWNVFAELAPVRAQLGEWAVFVFSAGAFWLVANRIRDVRWLKLLVWVFLGLGSLYIASRLMGSAGARLSALWTYGSTGSLFWVWLVALAGGQALFNHNLAWHWRAALAGLVGATFVVALTGEARSWASGWVPPLLALGLLIWFRWPRGSLLLGVAVALLALIDLPAIQAVLVGNNQYSVLTRGAALSIMLEIIKTSPFLGVGPANYYYYTPLYPILGYYVRFNSHNQYVDIVAQTGLVGMFFFTWFAVATGRVGWSLRRKFSDGFARGYIYAALAGLAGTLLAGTLGDWFLPFVYNIGLVGFRTSVFGWLFLGGLVVFEQLPARPAATENT